PPSLPLSRQVTHLFGVRHYAGEVAYNTQGFLDKNRDTLPKETAALFLSSDSSFVQSLFKGSPPTGAGAASTPSSAASSPLRRSASHTGAGGRGGGGGTPSSSLTSLSVSSQFKQQLLELMSKVHRTRPHYIRCLKPNDKNVPDTFNRFRITEQLRYGGVLEAVRVARSGYPVRLVHSEFYARYRCLAVALALPPSRSPSLPHVIDAVRDPLKTREWCWRVLDAILENQVGR
ncbi:Myosin head, motor domain protein, partial [Nannochloropsis gaditana]